MTKKRQFETPGLYMVVSLANDTRKSGPKKQAAEAFPATTGVLETLNRLRHGRRLQNITTLALVLLGPVLTLLTYLVLGPLEGRASSPSLRIILLVDLVYVLVVAALVLQRVAQMVAARRAHSAGSRLHLRLTGVFALLALAPTVLVAVFAVMTVNIGLEGWFSDRVRQVVGNSLAAAEAYENEHRRDLVQDADVLANFLNGARKSTFYLSGGELRQLLTRGQSRIQRGLSEAFVIDSDGQIRARGERSYLFDYEKPTRAELNRAANGETVVIKDWANNQFRALVRMPAFLDRYLYVSRQVDGKILSLLDDTRATVGLYRQLEHDRGRLVFEFGLLYLGFAVILILAAVWLGLWFAERLSRPVGRLTDAAQRVGAGDLDVQVIEESGDDEIAMLGRYFNQMTHQLKGQRQALLDNTRQIERRRRLFDSVLGSVTSGVVGLGPDGQIAFVNRSAERLLRLDDKSQPAKTLALAIPEFTGLFEKLRDSSQEVTQGGIKLVRAGALENLLVRISTRRNDDGHLEGYVVAFDDVTDLVSAQRMAAWGDVARRIAHEIKNPLTPIQLSAERLKRKFLPLVGDQAAQLDQYTDVIIRQTGDLRRIVDEFSRFARMPEPERKPHDLVAIVRDAVLLQQSGQPGVAIKTDIAEGEVIADLDATMISQALTNLIKNAGEAIETYQKTETHPNYHPEIRVALNVADKHVEISISDNGIGLPEDRARLFEPYVTSREHGTGLGLSIVKKIIEEHGGSLHLVDAEKFGNSAHVGACACIILPRFLTEARTGHRKQLSDGEKS